MDNSIYSVYLHYKWNEYIAGILHWKARVKNTPIKCQNSLTVGILNPLYQYYCSKKGKINEQNKINYYYQLFKGSGCTKNKCQLPKKKPKNNNTVWCHNPQSESLTTHVKQVEWYRYFPNAPHHCYSSPNLLVVFTWHTDNAKLCYRINILHWKLPEPICIFRLRSQ